MKEIFYRRNYIVRKIMLTFSDNSKIWLVLRGESFIRGIPETELIRAVVIPEWLKSHPEELE